MPSCDVRTVAADVRARLKVLLGETVLTGSSIRRLVDLLSSISEYASQNQRINVHLHFTGHDKDGNTFWLPVHEDQQLLDSAAGKVMAMVYRFAESGDAMNHGSDVINPLLNCRTSAGVASRAEGGLAGDSTVGADEAHPRAALSTTNSRSQVLSAPVGTSGPNLIVAPGAAAHEDPPDSSSGAWASTQRGVGVGQDGGHGATGRSTQQDASADQLRAAAAVAGDGGHRSGAGDGSADGPDAETDGGDGSADDDDFLMESRYRHSRRRSRTLKAPLTTRRPSPVVPSDATVAQVLELLDNSRPKQHVRAVIPLMSAAMRSSAARTVQSMRLTLPWWPRKSTHDVWEMPVVVRNCVLAKLIPGYEVTEGQVTVTLPRWLTKRDDVPTERVANVLLLAEMEPTAMEALKTYIRSFKPQPLHQVARTAPPVASLASVANLRAVARVPPTPGEQAMRLADPRRPNSAFNATPLRPSNWVATGSNPPTHHHSRMPPPPFPGASHAPPAGSTGASERGAHAASSGGTAFASAAAFDSQSVRDALLAAQRVIESCAPTSSPERSARPSATSRPATSATGASRNMQDRPAARRAAAAASPSTTPLSSATDAQHVASSATTPATPPASAQGAMAACSPSAVARAAPLGASPQPAASAPATASPRTVARVAPRPSPGTPGGAPPVRTRCAPPRPASRPASPGRRRPPPTPTAGSQPPLGASPASRSTSPLRTDGQTVGRPGHPLRTPLPYASPPDEPAALLSFARASSPRRTISWADEGGTPVAGGRRSDSAPPRVEGQDGNAREPKDGDGVTVKRPLAAPAVQLVAGGSSGQRARLRLGRQPFGSDRALAQMQAAVASTGAGGMHLRSAAAPPAADGEPSLAGVGAAAAAPPPVSAALREPTTPVELTTPSSSSALPLLQFPPPGGASNDGHDAQAANHPRNPTAATTASAKDPSTLTVTRSVGKRVAKTAAAAAAAEDEEPGTLPKKRRVGIRSTAARPPVMPKPKPTGEAKSPSTRPSVKAAPDNSPCKLYVDGGRLVAEGRLLKSRRVLHGRAVDADLVVVCVLSVRAGMHSYPY